MNIPSQLDGFDVPGAVGRMLDRRDLWWQALGLFVGHFADWEAAWRRSQGDDAEERRCVHALRSAAANVGADHVAEAAGALEKALDRALNQVWDGRAVTRPGTGPESALETALQKVRLREAPAVTSPDSGGDDPAAAVDVLREPLARAFQDAWSTADRAWRAGGEGRDDA